METRTKTRTAEKVDVIDLLQEMVRFKSLSHQEGPIADFVMELVESRGISAGRLDNNVYFWIGDGEDLLLLNSHLDVVPESVGHRFDPFEPVVLDGMMYGRGSVDAKASGAAMTAALLELAAADWSPRKGTVMVALTACEELGRGYNGLEDLRPHLPNIGAALIGEPTNLKPCTAQKGLLMLKVHSEGRSSHAARSSLGKNAIEMAARDIQRLTDLQLDRVHPQLGHTMVTVTMIDGGSATNVVPDRCTFTVDIRSTPSYTHDELIAIVKEALESTVEVYSDRLVSVSVSEDERIARSCIAGSGESPFGSPTMSDWIFLKDVPAVKIGPGSSELSHTAEEHIEIAEVRRAVELYKRIIMNYYDLALTGSNE